MRVTTATLRAEVVAQDHTVGERFRTYLEGLSYEVAVIRDPSLGARGPVHLLIYHVPHAALLKERRAHVRPDSAALKSGFWLEALWKMRQSAPNVPIVVAFPAGEDFADRAIDSGATDVIDDTVTPKMFRRRMEMIYAYHHSWPRAVALLRPQQAPREARQAGVLELPLPGLRSEASGRIDAQRVAEYLGVPLRRLAEAMEMGYAGLHKTPDSARVQPWLQPVVHTLELANRAFGSPEQVRIWLNRPLAELEGDSPLQVMLAGEAGAVETLLENALTGIPG